MRSSPWPSSAPWWALGMRMQRDLRTLSCLVFLTLFLELHQAFVQQQRGQASSPSQGEACPLSIRDLGDCRFFQLRLNDVVTLLVAADELAAVALRDLLRQERPVALRARLENGLVPQREVTLRIVRAAVEHLAAPGLAHHDVAAVLGTDDAGRFELDVLALGVAGARRELAEAAGFDDEVLAAVRALLVEDLVRLRGADALLGRDDLPRRLALGIARAGEEHAEAPALDHHLAAAVLARLVEFLGRRFGGLELLRVVAVGIPAAGQEDPELAGLLDHLAFVALVAGDARRLPFLEVGHFLRGALQILLERLVERRERFLVVGLALFDLVELVLHPRRVFHVQDVVEDRMQQLVDEAPAENRRPELALDLVHVVARLQHRDDRRVRARTADAILFERLDQRPFVETRRWLRELLLGRELFQINGLSFAERGQYAALGAVLFGFGLRTVGRLRRLFGAFAFLRLGRALAVHGQPAGELGNRTLRAKRVGRTRPALSRDVDRRVVEHGRHHLRRDEAVPDQPIQVVLVLGQVRAHLLGVDRKS